MSNTSNTNKRPPKKWATSNEDKEEDGAERVLIEEHRRDR